jgi:hypothetical protein
MTSKPTATAKPAATKPDRRGRPEPDQRNADGSYPSDRFSSSGAGRGSGSRSSGAAAASANAQKQPRVKLPVPDAPPFKAYIGNLSTSLTESRLAGFLEGLKVCRFRAVDAVN